MLFWVARAALRKLYNHFMGAFTLQLFQRILLIHHLWGMTSKVGIPADNFQQPLCKIEGLRVREAISCATGLPFTNGDKLVYFSQESQYLSDAIIPENDAARTRPAGR
jgi:hypothetical protein